MLWKWNIYTLAILYVRGMGRMTAMKCINNLHVIPTFLHFMFHSNGI